MNIKKQTHYSFLLLLCLVNQLRGAQAPQETWITVFVHGIMSIQPHLKASNFLRFMTDNVHNTVYSETVDLMRNDPLFHKNQAMQGMGLQPMSAHPIEPGHATGAMVTAFETITAFANPNKTIDTHYYTYGWSGLLSPKQRYLDAIELYQGLSHLMEEFQARGITPKIRVIGYSHGGNVVLNLGLVHQREHLKNNFSVDELVLIGVPIQSETDYLINDSLFKKIYHLYSRGDRIQKLDFFSFNRFFSRRLFKKRRGFALPEKLIQIQIKVSRTTPTKHCRDKVAKEKMPYKLKNRGVLSGKSKCVRDSSPGHAELWFFSWTPQFYRDTFPLAPLPTIALLPLIIRDADNFPSRSRFEKPTLIDIRPEQELVIIKNQKSHKTLTISRFVPHELMENLGKRVLQYKPEQVHYNCEIYKEHIQIAVRDAYSHYEEKIVPYRKKPRNRGKQKAMLYEFASDDADLCANMKE